MGRWVGTWVDGWLDKWMMDVLVGKKMNKLLGG